MEYSEILRRVVSILTQSLAWNEQLQSDPTGVNPPRPDGTLNELVREMIPSRFAVPEDATPQQVASALAEELIPAIHQMAGAFTLAFVQLAAYHDEDQRAMTAGDVLRELALRAEEFGEP
ncbi:hypothetical protein [Streptomyces mirabilis]|uniref:hypothetical protein n=1 Tax=Streptomyces mirabilis TaxID=68239 RepID=UPI00341020C3